MSHDNKLTDAELERLALLSEELGEVQQIIGKIIRHGYDSFNPYDREGGTNRRLLERELGDLLGAMLIMEHSRDLDHMHIHGARADKLQRVRAWLHHHSGEGDLPSPGDY